MNNGSGTTASGLPGMADGADRLARCVSPDEPRAAEADCNTHVVWLDVRLTASVPVSLSGRSCRQPGS